MGGWNFQNFLISAKGGEFSGLPWNPKVPGSSSAGAYVQRLVLCSNRSANA